MRNLEQNHLLQRRGEEKTRKVSPVSQRVSAGSENTTRELGRMPHYLDDPRLAQAAKDRITLYAKRLEQVCKDHEAWLERQTKVPHSTFQDWLDYRAMREQGEQEVETQKINPTNITLSMRTLQDAQTTENESEKTPFSLSQREVAQLLSHQIQTTEGGNASTVLHQWEAVKKEQERLAQVAAEEKKQAALRAQRKKEYEEAMKVKKEEAKADPTVWQKLAQELQEQQFDQIAESIKESWQGKTLVSVSQVHEQKASVLLKPIKQEQEDTEYLTPVAYEKTFQERSKAAMKLSFSYKDINSNPQAPKTVTKALSFGLGNFVTFEGESWEEPDNDFWQKKEDNIKAYYVTTPRGVTWAVPVTHPQARQVFFEHLSREAKNSSPANLIPKKEDTPAVPVKKKQKYGPWYWLVEKGLLEYLLNKDFYDREA